MTNLSRYLKAKLRSDLEGEVLFDLFSRGRYGTDASHYQVIPDGVVIPRTFEDVRRAIELCRLDGVPIIARGGGSSQCGQTVNRGVVIDFTKYLNKIIHLDPEKKTCTVQPGIVLDELNAVLNKYNLWFPVDVSTASRATIGGMTGNNSAGSRSIKYGMMRDNVVSVMALLADGTKQLFSTLKEEDLNRKNYSELIEKLLCLGEREKEEIAKSFPKIVRRVGGYNIDALVPCDKTINLAQLLTGSEGTLACFEKIELKLSPLPQNKVLGVCHFPTFYEAMDSAQHLIKLRPTAVELIDRTMIELAHDIELFKPIVERFVRGKPDALFLVEFAEDDQQKNISKLTQLSELMADLGFSWKEDGRETGAVIEAVDPAFQRSILEVRKAGMNIMMSMKEEKKPISFVEDCAVQLENLAEFTSGLTDIFSKYGTRGTWYAHASVGCLHVRPVLNLKLDQDVKTMRAIAEETFDMVRDFRGSHSGEHGDGFVRSEFHEKMFGKRMVKNFLEVKNTFDPDNIFNPGKIVNPEKMDDRRLFRFGPEYHVKDMETVFDWSKWPGASHGFQGAVEMCNNNGSCRKMLEGAMCPSYRVTKNERDSTRGRANTLRLAISGQLGSNALASEEMAETMKLCVSCKSCKRECPTGIDMAKMKIEVTAARKRIEGLSIHEHLIAWMPLYAPILSKFPWLGNLRNSVPLLARIAEKIDGFTSRRPLPYWRSDIFSPDEEEGPKDGKKVILFGDTFSRYFESENLQDAKKILISAGYRVLSPKPVDGQKRPLCCGRTYLTAGKVEHARREATRLLDTFYPLVEKGITIVGLEPSCLLCLRDEIPSLLPGRKSETVAQNSKLFEEFCLEENLQLNLKPIERKALIHAHCHQKAFNLADSMEKVLEMVPSLEIDVVHSSCCGMAGVFGYGAKTYDISMKMGEMSIFPTVRAEPLETMIVANGVSCRHQIEHGTGRQAIHVVNILRQALE